MARRRRYMRLECTASGHGRRRFRDADTQHLEPIEVRWVICACRRPQFRQSSGDRPAVNPG